jgi:hypothetical protein
MHYTSPSISFTAAGPHQAEKKKKSFSFPAEHDFLSVEHVFFKHKTSGKW